MAKIKPFKALRFNETLKENISKNICPVYDIINEPEYNKYLNKSPHNIIRLEKPVGYDCYNKAKNTLNLWTSQNILSYEDQDSIYIYEQEFIFDNQPKKIHGIICLVKIEDFEKQIIIPHETTLNAPKNDRLNLLKTTKSMFSPIFSLYDDKNNITENRLIPFMKKRPEIEFKDDNNIIHRLWIIKEKSEITKICNDFTTRKLYIADGHHRYETAQKFKTISGNKYTMMYLSNITDKNIIILPTHRLIKNKFDLNLCNFFNECTKYFNIIQLKNELELQKQLNIIHNKNNHGFGLYINKKYYILILKSDIQFKSTCSSYDVSIFNDFIIEKILNKNINIQKDIDFTRDIKNAIKSVDEKKYSMAFILNPTTLPQIINAANSNEKMPQKSTYFFTKVIAGLTMYKIE